MVLLAGCGSQKNASEYTVTTSRKRQRTYCAGAKAHSDATTFDSHACNDSNTNANIYEISINSPLFASQKYLKFGLGTSSLRATTTTDNRRDSIDSAAFCADQS